MEITLNENLQNNIKNIQNNVNVFNEYKLKGNIEKELSKIIDVSINENKSIKIIDETDNKLLTTVKQNIINNLNASNVHLDRINPNITLHGTFSNINTENMNTFFQINEKIINSINILKYLILLSDNNTSTIICGSNGVGKTSFASYIKTSYLNNILVFPAEKFLFYNDINTHLKVNKTEFINSNKSDPTQLIKNENINNRSSYSNFSKPILDKFTISMIYLVNNYVSEISSNHKDRENNSVQFDKINELFKSIFNNLTLIPDTFNRLINVHNAINDKTYPIDNMSEGEKVALFYLVNVMLSPENSYILIDEPETFMNPLVYIKLWDLLQKERSDCKFIFISHSVEFIESRTNAKLLWIKSFSYPNEWNFKFLDDNDTQKIPKDLLLSLIGTKKPLLLCEGTKDSLDYKVFSKLFINEYSVIPVGGHDDVIHGVKSINELIENVNISTNSIGIIDGDGLFDNKNHKNIFKLPFNEIEMLLISKDVLNAVMKNNYPDDYNEKVDEFIDEFKNIFKKRENEILINSITNRINEKLSNKSMVTPNKLDDLKSNFQKLFNEFESILEYNNLKNKLNEIIREDNYQELLKYCSLKKAIVPGLTKKMENNYVQKAITRITYDEKLQKNIKNLILDN